jgi:nitrogen fixation/metabolism regulation signal transduction histidine kinase
VLSREIVENHGGVISLENRPGSRGCLAQINMPLSRSSSADGVVSTAARRL